VLSRELAESLTLTRQGARNQEIRICFGIGFLHISSARDYIPVQPQKVQLWRKIIGTGRHEVRGICFPTHFQAKHCAATAEGFFRSA
jgi:hypothetical protein